MYNYFKLVLMVIFMFKRIAFLIATASIYFVSPVAAMESRASAGLNVQELVLGSAVDFQTTITSGFKTELAQAVNTYLSPEASFPVGNDSKILSELEDTIFDFFEETYPSTLITKDTRSKLHQQLIAFSQGSQIMPNSVRQVFPAFAASFVPNLFKDYLNVSTSQGMVNLIPQSAFSEPMTGREINLCIPDNKMAEANLFLTIRSGIGFNYIGRMARLDAFNYYNSRYPQSSIKSEFIARAFSDTVLSQIIIEKDGQIFGSGISRKYFGNVTNDLFKYRVNVPDRDLYNCFSALSPDSLKIIQTGDFFFETHVIALFKRQNRRTEFEMVDAFNKGLNNIRANSQELMSYIEFIARS